MHKQIADSAKSTVFSGGGIEMKRPLSGTAVGGAMLDSVRFSHSDLRSGAFGLMTRPGMNSQEASFNGMGPAQGAPTTCAECAQKCPTSSCSAVELTEQCTDQCMVISCNEFLHGDTGCQRGAERCEVDDCAGCTAFEELLQCCSPAYCSELPQSIFQWDPSAECGCTEQSQKAAADVNNKPFDFLPAPGVTGDSVFPYPDYAPSETTPAPNAFTCLWGDCHQSFTSISELVRHVNLQHLRLSSPTTLPPGQTTGAGIDTGSLDLRQDADTAASQGLSCLWADCNVYPSASRSQPDSAVDVLATHLLQDHLGLPPREFLLGSGSREDERTSITSTSQLSRRESTALCHAGIHVCRWRLCEQICSTCEELTEHIIAVHVGSGKAHYECFWGDCSRNGDRGFSSKQKICRHLQSHTGHRPFQCTVCQQNFSEAATLQQHMRRHTQEKPYVCDYPGCGKAFAITGALTIHKRIHNGDRPFKCTYCDRAFAESSNLSKHLRTHTGARPYVCTTEGCGKAFARPDQLSRHHGVHRRKDTY